MSIREDLEVSVAFDGRPIDNRVTTPGHDIAPDVPVRVSARRVAGGFEVEGPEGRVLVQKDAPAEIVHGAVGLRVGVVKRFRLPRWSWTQGDIVLPLLVLSTTLLALQFALLMRLFGGEREAGGGPPEPSPEFIARLLDEDYEGSERGLISKPIDRPAGGVAIESYYLQPGSHGPTDKIGGGKRVGKKRRDGALDGGEKAAAVEELEPFGQAMEEPPVEAVAEVTEPGTGSEEADGAVELNEGWGLTDWYDTEDARRDRERIQDHLDAARRILRIDPDDPYALSIRAYYEYLAMDQEAARKTYNHILRLYPEDAAAWNNLALTYKREAKYPEEEELYRISLSFEPDEPNTLNNLAICVAHQGRYEEALQLMDRVDAMSPDDPYAELYRAQIYAMMGKEEQAYRYLRKSLGGMRKLDTLHNIEYQQDIRVDPAFETMRQQKRFRKLLLRYYGDRPGGWWTLPALFE